MRRGGFGLILCLLFLGPLRERARGALLDFVFSGTITSWYDPGDLLGLGKTHAFRGRFTYDPTALDTDPSPNVGVYPSPIPVVTCTVGTLTVSGAGTTGQIRVEDARLVGYSDLLGFSTNNLTSSDVWVQLVSADLRDETRAALTGDALPVSAADVQGFPGGQFALKLASAYAEGHVTAFTIVPEPGALVLLGVGALLVRRGRRSRNEGSSARHPAYSWAAGAILLVGVLFGPVSVATAQGVAQVYAGTQGGGGPAKIYRWVTGATWSDLTPDGLGTPAPAAVMDLAWFDNQLWAAVQTEPVGSALRTGRSRRNAVRRADPTGLLRGARTSPASFIWRPFLGTAHRAEIGGNDVQRACSGEKQGDYGRVAAADGVARPRRQCGEHRLGHCRQSGQRGGHAIRLPAEHADQLRRRGLYLPDRHVRGDGRSIQGIPQCRRGRGHVWAV